MTYLSDGTPEPKEVQESNDEFFKNKDWERHHSNGLTLFCVVTHELRSSLTNEQLAPFARINDGKMHLMEF